MKTPVASLLVVVTVMASCGREVEPVEVPQPFPAQWAPSANSGKVDSLLGDVVDVPGGAVRIGEWQYDRLHARYVPEPCDSKETDGLMGSIVVRTAPFRMMRLEVSSAQYAACVRMGRCQPPVADLSMDPTGATTWDDPRRDKKPAVASYTLAREFCAAFGGDLPTYPEWIRAAEGDGGEFGIGKLTEQFMRCVRDASLPLCHEFYAAGWRVAPNTPSDQRKSPLADVGSTAWDVGPYGHGDLFGSAAEWVRHGTQKQPFSCAADGVTEGEVFAPTWDRGPNDGATNMQLAIQLFWASPTGVFPMDSNSLREGRDAQWTPLFHGSGDLASKTNIYSGFRCAFPSTPPR